MNGEVCCILQVCCPPSARAAALATEMCHEVGHPLEGQPEAAQEVAEWIFKHFDLAPAGTLGPLVSSIAAIARASQART